MSPFCPEVGGRAGESEGGEEAAAVGEEGPGDRREHEQGGEAEAGGGAAVAGSGRRGAAGEAAPDMHQHDGHEHGGPVLDGPEAQHPVRHRRRQVGPTGPRVRADAGIEHQPEQQLEVHGGGQQSCRAIIAVRPGPPADPARRAPRHGLTLRHLSALGHLSRQPGLSYSKLGRRAGVTAQSMQATLRQLEHLGAVERRTLAGRGRTAELHVTAAGAELLGRGLDLMRAADARVLDGVPADHRDALTALLLDAFVDATRRQVRRTR